MLFCIPYVIMTDLMQITVYRCKGALLPTAVSQPTHGRGRRCVSQQTASPTSQEREGIALTSHINCNLHSKLRSENIILITAGTKHGAEKLGFVFEGTVLRDLAANCPCKILHHCLIAVKFG